MKNSDIKWIFDLAARGMRDSMGCNLEIGKAHRGNIQHVSVQKSKAVLGELHPKGQGGFTIVWSHGMTSLVSAQMNMKY